MATEVHSAWDPIAAAAMTPNAIASARRTVERAARDAVPKLADFCVVHVVSGRRITALAGAHATPGGDRVLRALMHAHRIRTNDRDSTVAYVVRTRRPTLRSAISTSADPATRDGGIADLHRRLAPTSALVVPIVHDNTVLGAVSLCYSLSGRSFGARHLPGATRLATRLAAALINGTSTHAPFGLRAAARHPRQGTTLRRRLASRA